MHRLTRDQAEIILRAPFAKPEAGTAFSPAAPVIAETSPEDRAALNQAAKPFTTDKKGQDDFVF